MSKHIMAGILSGIMLLFLCSCGAAAPQEPGSVPETAGSEDQDTVIEESVPQNEPELEAKERQSVNEITLLFGNTEVTAVLDDSETTQAFLDTLPLTLTMNRYADREYYAAIPELPENGDLIPDFENGDITYYTAGKSLAVFFANADSSSQGDLIRMGKITSDLSLFDSIGDSVSVTISLAGSEGENEVAGYDFSDFTNVELIGANLSDMGGEELSVLYQQARYYQAMTDADTETMGEIVSEDMVFTHMSGRQQTREEYFADVRDSSLRYFTIGIENPVVEVNGDLASVTYTSVLNADAYGARGTYRMQGTHWFEKRDGSWRAVNNPDR